MKKVNIMKKIFKFGKCFREFISTKSAQEIEQEMIREKELEELKTKIVDLEKERIILEKRYHNSHAPRHNLYKLSLILMLVLSFLVSLCCNYDSSELKNEIAMVIMTICFIVVFSYECIHSLDKMNKMDRTHCECIFCRNL